MIRFCAGMWHILTCGDFTMSDFRAWDLETRDFRGHLGDAQSGDPVILECYGDSTAGGSLVRVLHRNKYGPCVVANLIVCSAEPRQVAEVIIIVTGCTPRRSQRLYR